MTLTDDPRFWPRLRAANHALEWAMRGETPAWADPRETARELRAMADELWPAHESLTDAQERTVAFVEESLEESLGMGAAPCSAKWFRMAEPVCPEETDGQHRCRKTAPHLGHHACACGNTNVNRHPIDPSRASLPTADTPLRPERLLTPDEIETERRWAVQDGLGAPWVRFPGEGRWFQVRSARPRPGYVRHVEVGDGAMPTGYRVRTVNAHDTLPCQTDAEFHADADRPDPDHGVPFGVYLSDGPEEEA